MVKIGIIGIGKWGINHLKSLKKIDCEIIGISDVNPEIKKIADEYQIKFYLNYLDLLNETEAVTIAGPTDLHYEMVKKCLQNGKHVLVEKPISLTSKQSKELITLAKNKNLVLSVGYLFRFNNSIKYIKKQIDNIGKIQYITCRYIHSTKPPRRDSGVILNLGIHVIDILNFILKKKPSKVYVKKKNLLSKKFEDSAIIILDYKDFFASIELSCTHPEKKRDMWIIAEKEKIYVDFFNQKILRYPIIVSYEQIKHEKIIEEKINPNEPLKDELEYFIKYIQEKKKKKISYNENIGNEDYYTTRICELSIKSAETGKEMIIK